MAKEMKDYFGANNSNSTVTSDCESVNQFLPGACGCVRGGYTRNYVALRRRLRRCRRGLRRFRRRCRCFEDLIDLLRSELNGKDSLLRVKDELLRSKDERLGDLREVVKELRVTVGCLRGFVDGVFSELIVAGGLFYGATSVIRYYGDSMVEYPSGCILVLKEVSDMGLIVWGENYVIETDDLIITGLLERGEASGYIRVYSSNEDTYQDGTLIHEPMDIPLKSIRKLAFVLGYVVKRH
jgi:hypothetical protein